MTPDKRKFVLIDQSICELGGHHYEYAIRVLAAASEDGMDARLVTNKNVPPSLVTNFPVLPIYSFGHWDRPLRLGPLVIRSFPPPELIRLVRRAVFAVHHGISRILSRPRGAHGITALTPDQTAHGSNRPRSRFPVDRRVSAREFLRPVITALRSAVGGARFYGLNGTKILQFERETVQTMAALQLRAGDIVFFPTLCEAELLGLGRALRACNPDNRIGWHLLFRRPPAPARVAYAGTAGARLAQVRKCFAAFAEATRGHQVHFYTDTEPLTQQYNDLRVVRFATLPIPVPSTFIHSRDPEQAAQPVPTILFAGDARIEKGFQLLPSLISDLKKNIAIAETQPRFIVQSNFSVPGGEPVAARARSELERLAEDGVWLIREPLLPDAYCAIFHASDISLIAYDRLEYRARSSGVFAESVAAGLVTVVPSCTWMAAQLDAPIAAYHRALLRGPNRIQVDPSRTLNPRQSAAIQSFDLPLPVGADHLILKVRSLRDIADSMPIACLEWVDFTNAAKHRHYRVGAHGEPRVWTFMFRLSPSMTHPHMIVTSQEGAATVRFSIDELVFFNAGHSLPLSAAGVVYADETELTGAVQEILNHTVHYVRTATTFSSEWITRHTPHALEQKLRKHQEARSVKLWT
jgi:hypothetical protein